jgi:hypothetical protein
MKSQLIGTLVNLFVQLLSPDLLKQFADMVLDFVENYVAGSKSTIDDAIVMPLCANIRTAFNIPDDDETTATAE